jgi:hypothetical protein
LSKVLSGSSRRHFPGEGERAPAASWCRRTAGACSRRPGPSAAGDDAADRPSPRGLSAGLARWRAPRAARDPGKVIADLPQRSRSAAAAWPASRCRGPTADGRPDLNSERYVPTYLCADLHVVTDDSNRQFSFVVRTESAPIESGASRRRPAGKGGPSDIVRGETAQVLTVASGRSADRSRATAMGRRPGGGGRWPCRAGRRGLPGARPRRRGRA